MEIKQIKELMASMGRTGIKRLELEKEGFKLQLERSDTGFRPLEQFPELSEDYPLRSELELRKAALPLPANTSMAASVKKVGEETAAASESAAKSYVTSPMVGTFYSSPSPDDPPFVKVGDRIDKNTVVCIVEAMKVMNEIKAGVSGTIVKVLVDSGHPVEFGTKLYEVAD